jgi:superfamily II DNA or RNA helicase/regulator of replication initiation timing
MHLDLGRFLAEHELDTPEAFRLRLQAEELTRRRPTSDFESMESLESSRDTMLYPHQIHAAHFTVSNPMLKGVLLADEVGLGKTIEAAMIIKEMIFRGGRNILVITSRSLCQQWAGELRERFSLDFQVLNSQRAAELKRQKTDPYAGLRISTYHFVNNHIGQFVRTPWDLVVIDEVHLLKNPQGALHQSIKKLPRKLSCLLTATPLQNYLPELHAISSIIDEEALGTAFSFREQFCEDPRGLLPKNLPELKRRLSRFAIRTLRADVPEIRFTQRTPKLFDFNLHTDEMELYSGVSGYLSRPNWAFGDNAAGKYLIVMVYRKLLASSSFALRGALRKVEERLEGMLAGRTRKPLTLRQLGPEAREALDDFAAEKAADDGEAAENINKSVAEELDEVRGYVRLCESITENAKGERLVAAMPELLQQGDKVLVFTQYKATQRYLARKLREAGYEVVEFSGDLQSHANPDKDEREIVKRQFHESADVMIATDAGAEGLNLQFCHIVVNYDLPWNPMKIEQRIGRCHRIGQQHDVVVANLVATENEVDARLVELLTDKIHLFDTVLGESDEILGAIEDGMDFERAVFTILQTCRTLDQIDRAFAQLQLDLEEVINERRTTGNSLLQGFDDRLRDHLAVAGARAQEALDKRTALLRDFTLGSLTANGASYGEVEPGVYRFSTPSQFLLMSEELLDPEYRGSFAKDSRDTVSYLTKHHPLVKTALDMHLRIRLGARTAVKLNYSGNHNIHGMEQFIGRTGWWLNVKVMFSGFETEDHMLQLGMLYDGDGVVVDDLLGDSLSRITSVPGTWLANIPLPPTGVVEEWVNARVEALIEEITERNATYYLERRAVIDKFYGSRGDGEILAELRYKVEEKQQQVSEVTQAIEAQKSAAKQMELVRERDRLDEELYQLQQRMQAEQFTNFEAKKKAVEELEQLRDLKHEVELVSVAQWTMV